MSNFRTFYSRPPFFMVITASSAEQLAAKVAETDARLRDRDALVEEAERYAASETSD